MQLYVLGINHHTATVDLRARIAILPERLEEVLLSACKNCNIKDIVILSTCNRTEIYAKTNTPESIRDWLSQIKEINATELEPHLYQYYDSDAVKHLMRVACGLDSMVLGEPQILGQVKAALHYSRLAQSITPNMVRVFEQVFHVAKRVRTHTALGEQAVSMGFAVVKLAKQMFSHLSQTTALLVATGEMNLLVARHLLEHGIGRIILCNRSIDKAHHIATELQASVISQARQCQVDVFAWTDLQQALPLADVISSCTGSMIPVLLEDDIKYALKQRKHQPMLIVDLAVPRDIEPTVANLEDVYLYTVDDLQHVIEGNIEQRRAAAREAEDMVATCVLEFNKQHRARNAAPAIASYRKQAELLRQSELDKAIQQLSKGISAQEVIERLSQALTAKLIHSPSQLLRHAGSLEEGDLLAIISAQFGITDEDEVS